VRESFAEAVLNSEGEDVGVDLIEGVKEGEAVTLPLPTTTAAAPPCPTSIPGETLPVFDRIVETEARKFGGLGEVLPVVWGVGEIRLVEVAKEEGVPRSSLIAPSSIVAVGYCGEGVEENDAPFEFFKDFEGGALLVPTS